MNDRRPTRTSTAGRVYLDLQNLARRQKRPTQEYHQLYLLEGFLSRLSASRHADTFILKGGLLLAAFSSRRPTKDVDVQARDVANDDATILALVKEIVEIEQDDGLILQAAEARAESIRDEDAYSGVRVTLPAQLDRARLTFHVDVSVDRPSAAESTLLLRRSACRRSAVSATGGAIRWGRGRTGSRAGRRR